MVKKTLMLTVLLGLLLAACGTSVTSEPLGARSFRSQEANVEEISFRSGKFRVVGDLRMPMGEGPHPAIIMVHGSGAATRNGAVQFGPMIEIFLRNGYAVFSWDKPGSGESTGKFDEGKKITQRAEILAEGIEVLVDHPQIDPNRIGLWGISQAGWVMPKALDLTDHVAFMIVVSGGAEDGIEQMAFQVAQQVLAISGSEEEANLVEQHGARALKATTYDEYAAAMQILIEIDALKEVRDIEFVSEEDWRPEPRDIDAFFDPMDIIRRTTIPMLVFFGALDVNIDPIQGSEAYESALQAAGNADYQIVMLPNSAHVFTNLPHYQNIMEEWLQGLAP